MTGNEVVISLSATSSSASGAATVLDASRLDVFRGGFSASSAVLVRANRC
jgi:hypothetical protein